MRLIKLKLMLYVHDFNPRTPCGMRRNIKLLQTAILHFNPRTPCGMRRISLTFLVVLWIFQSTHPLRDATLKDQLSVLGQGEFQSTHPLRDATLSVRSITIPTPDFNPRTPCGMRRQVVLDTGAVVGISIHAPAKGATPYRKARF